MFWDELERIDRNSNSVAVLAKRRLRAYNDFRDRSQPRGREAHSFARLRPITPLSKDEVVIALGMIQRLPKPAPRQAQRWPVPPELRVRSTDPGDFLKWTCAACGRFVFRWADSAEPGACPSCHSRHWAAAAWSGRAT